MWLIYPSSISIANHGHSGHDLCEMSPQYLAQMFLNESIHFVIPCLSSVHCLSSLSCLRADALQDQLLKDLVDLGTSSHIITFTARFISKFRPTSNHRKQQHRLPNKKDKVSN